MIKNLISIILMWHNLNILKIHELTVNSENFTANFFNFNEFSELIKNYFSLYFTHPHSLFQK